MLRSRDQAGVSELLALAVLPELLEPPVVPDPFGGAPWPAPGLSPGLPPGPHPPAIPDGGFPANNLSMAVVPSAVTVLKATVSPTASALRVDLPFFSMSLELVTA